MNGIKCRRVCLQRRPFQWVWLVNEVIAPTKQLSSVYLSLMQQLRPHALRRAAFPFRNNAKLYHSFEMSAIKCLRILQLAILKPIFRRCEQLHQNIHQVLTAIAKRRSNGLTALLGPWTTHTDNLYLLKLLNLTWLYQITCYAARTLLWHFVQMSPTTHTHRVLTMPWEVPKNWPAVHFPPPPTSPFSRPTKGPPPSNYHLYFSRLGMVWLWREAAHILLRITTKVFAGPSLWMTHHACVTSVRGVLVSKFP